MYVRKRRNTWERPVKGAIRIGFVFSVCNAGYVVNGYRYGNNSFIEFVV